MIQGVNSLNKKVPKAPKRTKANMAKWSKDRVDYNRNLSKADRVTLEDYISIIHGKLPVQQKTSNEPEGSYTFETKTPRRGSVNDIPSHQGKEYSCIKVEPQKYTGILIKGISQTHKSNAVPVINEQEMKDHANMRR
jgi:hypothetical protein